MHVYTYKHTHKFGFVNNHIGHLPKVIPLLEISIVLTYPFIFCVPIHSIGQHRLEFGIIPGATRGAYNLTFRLVSAFVGASRDLIFSCMRCRQLPCPEGLAVSIERTPATNPNVRPDTCCLGCCVRCRCGGKKGKCLCVPFLIRSPKAPFNHVGDAIIGDLWAGLAHECCTKKNMYDIKFPTDGLMQKNPATIMRGGVAYRDHHF